MSLELQRSKLAERVLGENQIARLGDFQFFADPDHEFLNLKSQRQAALDRVEQLAPGSVLLENIKDGTVSIDRDAITDLVNNASFNKATLKAERMSIEDAQAELKLQIFLYLCHDHEFLNLKSQRQAALDRVEQLAPGSVLLENIKDGTISIDRDAITDLVNNASFDKATLKAERMSIEDAQADQAELKSQTFLYLCHDIAFKFHQTYYEIAVTNRNNPEILTDKETGKQFINPAFLLQEKLRYMTLLLEVLSRSYEKVEKNSEAVKSSAYSFLKKANDSLASVKNTFASEMQEDRYQLAAKNAILPGESELDLMKVISDVWLHPDSKGYEPIKTAILASWHEFQRGISNQNLQAACYHVRAAHFLIESAYQVSRSNKKSAEELTQIGKIFALAGARKEWEDDPSILSKEQKRIFDKDDGTSKSYADLAASLNRGESSNLFKDSYYKSRQNKYDHAFALEFWIYVRGASKVASYYLRNANTLFDFYKASLAERVLYDVIERSKHTGKQLPYPIPYFRTQPRYYSLYFETGVAYP